MCISIPLLIDCHFTLLFFFYSSLTWVEKPHVKIKGLPFIYLFFPFKSFCILPFFIIITLERENRDFC